jgi:hypothetical protein
MRARAEGRSEVDGATVHDEIVVSEVMTEEIDRIWWQQYRRNVEGSSAHDEIVAVRAMEIEKL